uniref:Uncharacterized protein LOC117350902 n=1 Tax=Geotrypetes seraphini TaxID=260995 RepID=A0A6P8PCH6_GEOSA|nr:uncharacterized protein LOC117350902 [Geotrypetes seraphini]
MQDVTHDWNIVPDKGSTGPRVDAKPGQARDLQKAIYSTNIPSTLFAKQETVSTRKPNDLGLLRDSILPWPVRQTWGINNNEVKYQAQEGLESCNFKTSPENRSDSIREDDMGLDAGALGNQNTYCTCEGVVASLGGRGGRGNGNKLFTTVGIYKDDAKKLKAHLLPFQQDDTNQLLRTEQSRTPDGDLETCLEGRGERMYCFTSAKEKKASFTTTNISACLRNGKDSTVSNCDTDDHINYKQSQGDPFISYGQCLSKPYQCLHEDILVTLSHGERSKKVMQQTMKIHSLESSTEGSHSNFSSSETICIAQNKNPKRVPGLLEGENICLAASSPNKENLTITASRGVELSNDDSNSAAYLNKKKKIQEQERAWSKPDKSTKNKDGQNIAKYSTETMNPSQADNENFQLSSILSAESPSIKVRITSGYLEPNERQHSFARENADFLHSIGSFCTNNIPEVKEEYQQAEEKRIWQSIPEKKTEEEEVSAINAMSYTDSSAIQVLETSESGYSSKNITPITEARSWSSLGMCSQEDIRIFQEQDVIQKQMDCAVEPNDCMANRYQELFQKQCSELTITNGNQNKGVDNEENCAFQRNDMWQTNSLSLFIPYSLEFGRNSSEIRPHNTTDSFLQDVNDEEKDCDDLPLQLDIQLRDYCSEDKNESQHESTKHRKTLNKSYSGEAGCMTILSPIRVTKKATKDQERKHPYHMTDKTDLVDEACEPEDLRHSDCALELDCEINLVNNNDGSTTNLEIQHTDFAGVTSLFQDELHKPNRTPQRAAESYLSLNKTWESGNTIVPAEKQKANTCQHLTRRLSETPSASMKTSFENRNKELHVEESFHNDLLPDKTTNQSFSKLCRERTSDGVSGNQTMTEETPLTKIRHDRDRGGNKEPINMEASPEVSKEALAPTPLSSTVREDESMSSDIPWPESSQVISRTLAMSHNIEFEMCSTTDASKHKILTDSACIRTEPRTQHALSLSSAFLPTFDIQEQSKVKSGKHLPQRKGSMSEIAEQQQFKFQVNSISDHKLKPSLITRSCEDILSGAPKENINQSKAQSMLCLLTEHYSKYPRGQRSLVEFVSKGSFIHIPESLQDIVDAMKLQLTLGNCLEFLRYAKMHSAVDLQAAAYAVMSDNYLQVLRDPSLYRQLSGGERDQILQLRMRGMKVLGTVTLQNIYGMRSNSQSQSCALGNNSPSLAIGSEQKPWLYIFQLEKNSWHPLTPIPEEANLKGCGICSMHNYLFLAGGIQGQGLNTKCSNKVFCYNPLTDIWSRLAPMNQARSQLKLVPADGYLYAIGGECLYTVERYDPRFDKWTFRASLPKGSFAVAHEAANCNGDIYISGGNLFYRLFRYIPLKDLWEECPSNTSRKRSSDMVAVRNFLYRFDIHRDLGVSVFRYNTITRVWNECATLCLKTSLPFCCTVLDGTIYCLNKKMTARFLAHERPPRFESENLRAFPDNAGVGVLYPFVLSLPQIGCFQTAV